MYVKSEMEAAESIECSLTDDSVPVALRDLGHGSAEYGVVREFLAALSDGRRPALDALRAVELTAPGLIAHESALRGGTWLDVPSYSQP